MATGVAASAATAQSSAATADQVSSNFASSSQGPTIGDLKAAAKPSVAAVEIIGTADMHDEATVEAVTKTRSPRALRGGVFHPALVSTTSPATSPYASPRRVAKASRGMDGGGGDGTSRSDVANAISRATQRSAKLKDSSASSLNRLPRKPSSAQLGGGGGGGATAAASGVRSSSAGAVNGGEALGGTLGPSELSRKARAAARALAERLAAEKLAAEKKRVAAAAKRVAEAAKRRSEEERKELETRIAAEKGGSGGGSAALTEKERVAAERAAARRAAQRAMEKAAVRDAEIARENAERLAASKREAASMKKKLWARCKELSAAVDEDDVRTSVITRLRATIDAARKADAGGALERRATEAYKQAVRRATAKEKAAQALARWEEDEARDAKLTDSAKAAQEAAAAQRVEEITRAAERAAEEEKIGFADVTASADEPPPHVAPPASAAAPAGRAAPTTSSAATSVAAPPSPRSATKAGGCGGAAAAAATGPPAASAPTQLHDAHLLGLPPVIAVPAASAADMRNSLRPVLHALNHNLDCTDVELDAARRAFASWRKEKWHDPRTNTVKEKPTHGWTIEQYALEGFSGYYAQKLHVPRVAAARQVTLWLLQCAPGLPETEALSFGDLGAGTCAACLGARLALRDHAGDEQPYKTFPIDVASSSARFAQAFRAMTKAEKYGRPALLPSQDGEQYLMEAAPGVDVQFRSLLAQLEARREKPPHIVIASFCLQYLKKDERDSFFAGLADAVRRPMLLLIIKGVGENQRPSPHVVRSSHLGLHYVVHNKEKHPRVVEAHVCLILPTTHPSALVPPESALPGTGDKGGAAMREPPPPPPPLEASEGADDIERWVITTYKTVERRSKQHGLQTGTTICEEQMQGSMLY